MTANAAADRIEELTAQLEVVESDVRIALQWKLDAIAARVESTVWREVATQLAEALRLTAEYVGADTLPALEGWSWFDALAAFEAALEAHPKETP